ncbi:unnamed protein product [Sphagnum balticum]
MGFKTDNSPVDMRLSKMEATINNITSLAVVGNLAVNQIMKREAAIVVTTKGQMRLRTKVIAATWHRPVTARASTSMVGVRLGAVLLKFTTSEDARPRYEGVRA